jgi:ribonuclease P protein component
MLRESFRRLLPWMKDGFWMVASLRENALDSSAREVYTDLAGLLKRRKLLNGDWPGFDWDADRGAEKCR